MAALQLALVGFTLLALLGLLPLLYFMGHWYLVQQSPLETWESPQRSLSRRWSSLRRDSPAVAGFHTSDASGRGKAAGMSGCDVPGEHENGQSGPAAAAEDGVQGRQQRRHPWALPGKSAARGWHQHQQGTEVI